MTLPLFVVFVFLTPCAAELVEMDSTYGPSSITFDSDTGLEWLDVAVTVDVSVLDLEAALTDGGEYAGWRYATPAELEVLFYESTGLSRETIRNGDSFSNPDETPLYEEALRLFGITLDGISHGCIVCDRAAIGYNSVVVEGGRRSQSEIWISWKSKYMARVEILNASVDGGDGPDDLATFLFGHWLVRDSGIVPGKSTTWGCLKATYR